MYKENGVGTVIAETGRDCGTMARLSDLSMPFQLFASPLKGKVRRSREPSARSAAAGTAIAKSGNLYLLISGQRWIVKRWWSCAFSHRWAHLGLCLRGCWGERERFDMVACSEKRKPSCQSHKQRQLRPRSVPSKERTPQQRTASTAEPISKKGIKLIPKTIGNRKGDCVWSFSRWQTQPGKICKLQRHKSVQCAEWTLICALQFADLLRLCLSPRKTSRTISFSISNSFWY